MANADLPAFEIDVGPLQGHDLADSQSAFTAKEALELVEEGHPDIIFLDLRMPKKSGFDVLEEVKQDPTLASIPIVVQTSSAAPTDVERAYSLHANCYITKPADLDELSRTMRVLAEFWVTIAKLPDGGIHGPH